MPENETTKAEPFSTKLMQGVVIAVLAGLVGGIISDRIKEGSDTRNDSIIVKEWRLTVDRTLEEFRQFKDERRKLDAERANSMNETTDVLRDVRKFLERQGR